MHGSVVVGPNTHTQLFAKLLGALGVPHRGAHVARRHELLIQKCAQQNAAHLARA